ncbi:MAG TPA: DUF494 domain-containing protein [Gammaproteobacteria bacterium]|nr:DUF494 domain-containing protein [Gammaproteobacteria bacterium]
MKQETALDVLMYLFENYLDEEDDDEDLQPDRETLRVELEQAGFPGNEVMRAFDWLEGLADTPPEPASIQTASAMRIYCPEEIRRLDTQARGFILYLEQIGILNQSQRELVIDRIMALEAVAIDIDQVKWIILMVLFNQPGEETAFAEVEDLVLEQEFGLLH